MSIGQKPQSGPGPFLLHRFRHQIVEEDLGLVRMFGGGGNGHHQSVGDQIGLQPRRAFDARERHHADIGIGCGGFDIAQEPGSHGKHRGPAGQEQV